MKFNSILKNRNYLILILIITVGIFLRTYHLHDWLIFNPDQARDALLIQDVVENKAPLPLLGPEAGNTNFKLGPIFYWWEYAAAKIFGNSPEKLAYPDLLFGILAIWLLYVFLKKYFDEKISLPLTAIFSVSFFAVRYSRFAMNTNSIPFFTLLFLLALLEMLDSKNKSGWLWPTLAGIALGIGIQLHALLLIVMPLTLFIVLVIMLKRRIFSWKNFLIMLFFFLLLNAGQIVYEIQNRGLNTHYLFSSVTKESEGGNFSRNLEMDVYYNVQAGAHILSGLGNQDDSDFIKIKNRILKNKAPYNSTRNKLLPASAIVFCFIFFVAGYGLLLYFLKKEKETSRKNFLLLVFIYSVLIFVLIFPIIQEASLRYFIVILFLPFVLLGLWIRFLSIKNQKIGNFLLFAAAILLILSNLNTLNSAKGKFKTLSASSEKNAILGEVEQMEKYISTLSFPANEIYLAGKKFYFIRFSKPLIYVARQKGTIIHRADSDDKIISGFPLFYIQDTPKSGKTGLIKGRPIKDSEIFNRITIYQLEN